MLLGEHIKTLHNGFTVRVSSQKRTESSADSVCDSRKLVEMVDCTNNHTVQSAPSVWAAQGRKELSGENVCWVLRAFV